MRLASDGEKDLRHQVHLLLPFATTTQHVLRFSRRPNVEKTWDSCTFASQPACAGPDVGVGVSFHVQ